MGCDNRSFLSVVRSLGRAGLEVHVTGAPLDAPALQSRYIAATHYLPVYLTGDKTWLSSFVGLLEQHQFDLVIPCNDQSAIPLQLFRGALGRYEQRIYLLEKESYEIANDKQKTWELARELSIPVPRQMEISAFEELRSAAQLLGLPLVLKPRSSFTETDLEVKHGVRLVNSERELGEVMQSADRGNFQLAQEFFLGVGVGVEVLCQNGEVLVTFQHERVHEPLLGGGSSYRKSVPLHPELLDATRRLMAALRYTGVCMVEFRYNRSACRWVLLEMNGRFWGSLPLAIAAGVDFPLYLYNLLRLNRLEFQQKYRVNLFCRNSVADLGWLAQSMRTQPLSTAMNLFLESRHALLLRERCDTLVSDDPSPAWHELRLLLTVGALRGIIRLPGLRLRMRRKLNAHIGTCRAALIVCKGNICRSPFAAALLSAIAGDKLSILSGGFLPPGRKCPPAAVEAAQEWGIDLRSHRSELVSEQSLRMADIVLVFDLHQVVTIRALFPTWSRKTILLGAADDGPLEILDPFGKSVEEFRLIYARIETALRGAVKMLALEEAGPSGDFGTEYEAAG